MARISQNDRYRVIRVLLNPYNKKIEEAKIDIENWLSNYCKSLIPEEVKKVMEKYPDAVRVVSGGTYIGNYKWRPGSLTYVKIENYINCFCEKALLKLNNETLNRLCKVYEDKEMECKVLEKRLTCALNNINTEKQLKDEFPEAYEALQKIYNKEVEDPVDKNKCDSIEEVRALLSKKP